MAAEQDLKLDDEPSNAEGGKGGKKKLILIILIGLIVVGAAVGATLFFLMGSDDDAADADTGEVAEEVVEEPKGPAQYVILKPEFVISFQVGPRQRYLQLSLQVMTREQVVVDTLALHEPMIRNDIIRIISEQEFDTLRTAEGRRSLQLALTEHLDMLMEREGGVGGVEAVLFTNYVMQ
ncbi:flagellar protein [Bacterioplanes sanyensis]|uniref:Flagellar protein FliL n=1 Tax=Bacterioplanes sanyensis TaxID=1249553 RepID=A0A222FQS5_9GAMM|nr:flagellar basal body-associated FliL family protein [Bacterioplanes sanyensis]ASP40583.1 flagellar protein [Bacterioplanes sanyensis]